MRAGAPDDLIQHRRAHALRSPQRALEFSSWKGENLARLPRIGSGRFGQSVLVKFFSVGPDETDFQMLRVRFENRKSIDFLFED